MSDLKTAVIYNPEKTLRSQLLEFSQRQMELYASDDYIRLCRAVLSEFMHSTQLAKKP